MGRDPAEPTPVRADRRGRHHRGAQDTRCLRGAHGRRRAGRQRLRTRAVRSAGLGQGRGPLPGRGDRPGRGQPSRDRSAGGEEDPGRLRSVGAGHRRSRGPRPPDMEPAARRRRRARGRAQQVGGAHPSQGESRPPPEDPQGRPRCSRRRRPPGGRRRVLRRHAGPGISRARVGSCRARRAGRRRPLRRDAVAACRPTSGVRGTRAVAGSGAVDARWRRRRVRRPRGSVDARARLHARAAHRQAGQDGLQPRGVVFRARAPSSVRDALRARRRPRREARLRQLRHLSRRRGVRVEHSGGGRQRGHDGHRALRRRERPGRRVRRLHEQSAMWGDAWVRVGADGVRVRGADGQDRRRARYGSVRRAPSQRDGGGVGDAARPGDRRRGPGRGAARSAAGDAASCRARGRRRGCLRSPRAARRRLEHHPRRGRPARRRLCGHLQECRVLRGVRRLLDGPRAGSRRSVERRSWSCIPPEPR